MGNPRSLSGMVVQPGLGKGKAVLAVHGKTSDIPKAEAYVVIGEEFSPALADTLANAKAIVTDDEDFNSYASRIAKEHNIP